MLEVVRKLKLLAKVMAAVVAVEVMAMRSVRPPLRKGVAKTVSLPSSAELPLIPESEPWAEEYNSGLVMWWERVKSVLQFSLETQITPLTQEQIDFINKQMDENDD